MKTYENPTLVKRGRLFGVTAQTIPSSPTPPVLLE